MKTKSQLGKMKFPRGKSKKSARTFGRSLAAQASEITFIARSRKNQFNCGDTVKSIAS
jgi:hypothetical protein